MWACRQTSLSTQPTRNLRYRRVVRCSSDWRWLAVTTWLTACGFSPATNSDGHPIDVAMDVRVDVSTAAPKNCKELHAINSGLSSGSYMVDIGGTPTPVNCDMTTEGGGWTIVFSANSDDLAATPIAYFPGLTTVLGGASSALLAYRDPSLGMVGGYASLDMPTPWRSDAPFNVDGNDISVPVKINDGAPSTMTVRYGRQTFSSTCSDSWLPGGRWGRICVEASLAPFYNGFAGAGGDQCSDSTEAWNTTSCSPGRRFSIAVR